MAVLKASEVLHTRRLRLRRPDSADVEAVFHRYASDPAVTRYLAWPTHRSLDDTKVFLARSDADWATWPASAYLICRQSDGEVLGSTGLSFETEAEAVTGYVLARDAWGQGYATEALDAMVELARACGIRRLTAGCHPEHLASIRVLEKCGFAREILLHRSSGFPNLELGRTQDVLVFAIALRHGP